MVRPWVQPEAAGEVLGPALHPMAPKAAKQDRAHRALDPPAGSATETWGTGGAPSVTTGAEISTPAPSPYLRVTSWYPLLVRGGCGGGRTVRTPARYLLLVVALVWRGFPYKYPKGAHVYAYAHVKGNGLVGSSLVGADYLTGQAGQRGSALQGSALIAASARPVPPRFRSSRVRPNSTTGVNGSA
jgi:hypothetical protein